MLKRTLERICLGSILLLVVCVIGIQFESHPGAQEQHYSELERQLTQEADQEMKAIDVGGDSNSHITIANSERDEASKLTDLHDDLMMARLKREYAVGFLTTITGAVWIISLVWLLIVNSLSRRTFPSPS